MWPYCTKKQRVNSSRNTVFSAWWPKLEPTPLFPSLYMCSIDGTQYFSSKTVHCPNCLTTTHKNGETTYSHKVLQAAIMHPDMRQVIPLMPEEIRNGDGSIKQDCEINAGQKINSKNKRRPPSIRSYHCWGWFVFPATLYFKLVVWQYDYILAAKPDDHTYMMEWVEAYDEEEIGSIRTIDKKGKIHVYEWVNDVPLNGSENSVRVNFFRYKIISKNKNGEEKITYKNSWVTDLEITESNIMTLVKAGRCRWKIENECFNTLKNQGYHIEHNYGHGSENLCFNFLLTLLAFYFHQIFELVDYAYQACRKKFGSKQHLWESLRVYIKILAFESWEHLLDFALGPRKYKLVAQLL